MIAFLRCWRGCSRILLIGLLAASNACAFKPSGKSESKDAAEVKAPAAHAPRLVGTVMLVNEDDRFVLIDTGSLPMLAEGSALKTFTGEAESGIVNVGGVHRRPFVVADIARGAPKKGDRVFQ